MPGLATTSLADQVARVRTVNEDLLERVRESDAAAAQSVNAGAYAGEPDPYKKPREVLEDPDPADAADGHDSDRAADGDDRGDEDE